MNKHPTEWLGDISDPHAEDNKIIWISKSEIKRDAEALKDLGLELIELGKNALEYIPLDDDLRTAIELAKRIKKEGRRRQVQLIGKLLRARDPEPIKTALDKLKKHHTQQVALFHKLEQLRDRLLEEGSDAIPDILALYPTANRQQFCSLLRNVKKEKANNKPLKSYRQIFQNLRDLAEEQA
ncbi:MAG: ribosome biogenesis factor YjgA [Candidatus Malihini olakiniferum]